MEVARRRGRKCKKLLDDLKDRRGYSHLKEEALNRTMWRHRFGGGFRPFVRQNTEWMNEWLILLKLIFQSVHAREIRKKSPKVRVIIKAISPSKLVKYVKILLTCRLMEISVLLLNQMFLFSSASALLPLWCERSVHRTKGNSTTKKTNNSVCLKTLDDSCLIYQLNLT